jgi:hypothetical protein
MDQRIKAGAEKGNRNISSSAHVRWGDPDFLHVAPSMTACAAFSKENRIRFTNANN